MTHYRSKPLDKHGRISWSAEENRIWHDLIHRQHKRVENRACDAYLSGLAMLDLPTSKAPQLSDINHVLKAQTGWQVVPVPALIDFEHFFALLAAKQFPVATFLRSRDEFDYLQEPDFFHEVFGHCAMLTHSDFAHFTQVYGQLGEHASHTQRVYLARLYWFTVEFGLVKQKGECKIYGGGILSSPGETVYALESPEPERAAFDLQTVLRTPYRIDIMQPVYFVLEDIAQLYRLTCLDVMNQVNQAIRLGLLPARFKSKEVNHA